MIKEYELSNQTTVALEKAFVQHPVKQGQEDRLKTIHDRTEGIARQFCKLTPDSMEQREMIRCMREAAFWAKEAIVKNEHGIR
jgi:hypothetical protein